MRLSHFEAMLVFAALVSAVFAIITKSTPREQISYGVLVFFSFLGVAIVVGWLMYPLPF